MRERSPRERQMLEAQVLAHLLESGSIEGTADALSVPVFMVREIKRRAEDAAGQRGRG